MAASEEPPQPPALQYQTWVLKVSIHCQGCRKKVKKVLKSIEGVYTTSIDSQQQKVTVIGNVDPQTLVKKLIKTGRPAELCPDKPADNNEKKPGNDPKSNENSEDEEDSNNGNIQVKVTSPRFNGGNGGAATVRFAGVDTVIVDKRLPGNVTGGGAPIIAHPGGGGGGGGGAPGGAKKKKKKRKKSSGNAGPPSNSAPAATRLDVPKVGSTQRIDPNRPSQNMIHFPPQQACVVSYYNTAHPTASGAPAYYAPSSPYTCASYAQSTPLDSFEILSDENPNACNIM